MLPTADPGVVLRGEDYGAVLLHLVAETSFGLNAVAARVWELLPPACSSLDEVCAQMAAQFPDLPPEMLRAGIAALLPTLAAQGLIQGEAIDPACVGTIAAAPVLAFGQRVLCRG